MPQSVFDHPFCERANCTKLSAMRWLWIICLVAGLAGFAGQARADQTDVRLDTLFATLKASENFEAVVAAERKIWAIWLETPDQKVQGLLETGMIHMKGGANAEALKSFDEIVKLAPDFAEGWNKRATVHYLLGNFDASLADIEKTLALEPRHFGALSGRGLIYSKLEDLEKALVAFEAALDVHPNMAGAKTNVERIRRVLKEREI